MSKLDKVIGIDASDEYNEGFNAGISFIKTVLESKEFNTKLSENLTKDNLKYYNEAIIKTLKDFNV
jgi:hypothetical protein